jgi:hypothetical protein
MAGISALARTRTNVLLRTLDVRQILRRDSGKEEGIRNVEQHNDYILKDGERPCRCPSRTQAPYARVSPKTRCRYGTMREGPGLRLGEPGTP